SEREVGEAQLKRAAAQRDLLKKQYADANAMAQSDQDVAAAQQAIKAQEAKLAYLNQNVGASEAERNAADAHVATQEVVVEQAKYQAMQAGGAPQTASINPAQIEQRLADAKKREAEAQQQAAERPGAAPDGSADDSLKRPAFSGLRPLEVVAQDERVVEDQRAPGDLAL